MEGLMKLPNELLLLIVIASPTIETAVQLSSVNRRLRAIWLDNSDHIIRTILRHNIPAYEDAIALAVIETSFAQPPTAENLSPSDPRPSPHPRFWLPRLQRNAEFASSAVAKFNAWLDHLGPENYRNAFSYPSLPYSYYTIRQFVLAHDHPELQPALQSRLEASSTETLRTHYELCFFMCEWMDDDEQIRQGLPKNREDWLPEEEVYLCVNLPEWDWAFDQLDEALGERLHGTK